jgi:(1->4)-alpha-D-glucan 1-alpha-D-glucosylmutase
VRLDATYRLQLTPGFGFRQVRELVPYLRALGISHLYLSPSFQARAGSTHGYDVVDPREVSDALGGERGLRLLAGEGLGLVLDIVPNHMATSDENPFWADPELRKTFFDIDTRTGFHRRFFDIGELGGVRVEDEAVFETLHEKAFELVRDGVIDGLRIDHVDGLANPREYLDRLRRAGVEHVWVEKILEPGEQLRAWPVEGTTGYEFANDVMRLFVDPAGEGPFTRLYGELTGETRPFTEIAVEAKVELAAGTFAPELRELLQDVDVSNLAQALSSFHVYRTYVEPEHGIVADEDRYEISRAALSESLQRILLLEEPGHESFVTRFQQTTGPVMAKGVEDTAFYRYNRLVALNEVGGDPGRWSLSVDDFHRGNIERSTRFPRQLLTTFTHDTKRSPDVRARLVALTWHAREWEDFARAELDFEDRNEAYLALQTLVAAWPIEQERIDAYLPKAYREAKQKTNWLEPDEEWEGRIRAWVHSKRAATGAFAERLQEDAERIALGMLVLKLTSPGVPDVYQGDELEALALVDPDNRRPVGWDARRRVLDAFCAGAEPTRETMKLWVTWKVLDLRRRRPEAFSGGYMPLEVPEHVCAFLRGPDVAVFAPVRGEAGPALEGAWEDVLEGRLPFRVLERADGPATMG